MSGSSWTPKHHGHSGSSGKAVKAVAKRRPSQLDLTVLLQEAAHLSAPAAISTGEAGQPEHTAAWSSVGFKRQIKGSSISKAEAASHQVFGLGFGCEADGIYLILKSRK